MFRKIKDRQSDILLFGITPPKKSNPAEKLAEITARTLERIRPLPIDGLVLYDIQDEQNRTREARPFPFIETCDPYDYADKNLSPLDLPKIVYRATGKYTSGDFRDWLGRVDVNRYASVFVGSPSAGTETELNLSLAYRMRKELRNDLLLGGVLIPERHEKKRDEHIRMIGKIDQGCSFFVTQCVYNIEASKNLLSDYHYESERLGMAKVPVIFTLTTCGSLQTLAFMKWLGIAIPRWLENELLHSGDILSRSVELCRNIAHELKDFCAEKNIPFGINVESVSIRKQEIDASIGLVNDMASLLKS